MVCKYLGFSTSGGRIKNSSFQLEASRVWGGIEFYLDLIKEGKIWHVMAGRKTQIQRDIWLPRQHGLNVAILLETQD